MWSNWLFFCILLEKFTYYLLAVGQFYSCLSSSSCLCLSPSGDIWDVVEECTFKTLPHWPHYRPGSLSLIYSLWFFLYFLLRKASLILCVAKAGFCLPFFKKCLTQPLKNIYRLFLFSSVSLISTSLDHVFIDHLVNG